MKIPLEQITIKCCDCGDEDLASTINADYVRYHKSNGSAIRFPKDGLTDEQKTELSKMALRCECCQEDYEDQ